MYINSSFAKSTLQNTEKMQKNNKIFAHVKKKQYLCTVNEKLIDITIITYIVGIAKTIFLLVASYVIWTYRKK